MRPHTTQRFLFQRASVVLLVARERPISTHRQYLANLRIVDTYVGSAADTPRCQLGQGRANQKI